MTDFTFSKTDNELVKVCMAADHKSWEDKSLTELKARLKEYLKNRQRFVCCYCLRSLRGEFNLVIDIEHILPKHKHLKYMFELENLAASCKRCNMKMKNRRLDFLTINFDTSPDPFASENYFFIHPNRDVFEDHIHYEFHQKGRDMLVFYNVIGSSKKGEYAKEFFKLEDLTTNSFSKAQGLDVPDEDFYDGDPEKDDVDENEDLSFTAMKIDEAIENLSKKNEQL